MVFSLDINGLAPKSLSLKEVTQVTQIVGFIPKSGRMFYYIEYSQNSKIHDLCDFLFAFVAVILTRLHVEDSQHQQSKQQQ